jgi:hypothetical protein
MKLTELVQEELRSLEAVPSRKLLGPASEKITIRGPYEGGHVLHLYNHSTGKVERRMWSRDGHLGSVRDDC